QEALERRQAEPLDLARQSWVGFAHLEIIAPEIVSVFVMGNDLGRLGAQDIGIEQFAALIVIGIDLDSRFETFNGFFEAAASACELDVINVLRGGIDDEADEAVKERGRNQDLGRDGTAARGDHFEKLEYADGAED